MLALALLLAQAAAPPQARDVHVVKLDGLVHPLSASYLVEAIDRADADEAALLVIELDTPGGLVDSTKTIVQRMLSARTPIAVFVAPSGARAASAGFLLLVAADVAAMAPGTNTGAAHPVDAAGGSGLDEISSKKAESDLAAFARTLAENRERNVELAAKAVTQSQSFTEGEALEGGLIDLVAKDRAELLAQLDGRAVRRFDGREVRLATRGAVAAPLAKSFAQRYVGPLLRPEIVMLLLGLGMLGLYVELTHPGAIFPGVFGVLCLLLFGLAFQFLPVNAVGVALVAMAAVLFIAELKVVSHGLLGLAGTASLVAGLLLLFPRDVPALRVSPALVVPLAIVIAATMACVIVLATRARAAPVTTGAQGLLSETGVAQTEIAPLGKVFVHGELWSARSASPIPRGARVRVVAVEGLQVVVESKE